MSNVSEYLVNLINYSDFKEPDEETYRVSENSSGSPKSVETLEVTHSVSEVNASTDPENVPDMIKIQSMTNSSEVSTKDVECNTSDLQVLPECITNWIPVLQSAKSDFIHLIDDHIGAIRENANRIQSQHDEWILKLRMSQAKKIIKRKACIRRIRNELNNKTKNLNNLLDQLERIWNAHKILKNAWDELWGRTFIEFLFAPNSRRTLFMKQKLQIKKKNDN